MNIHANHVIQNCVEVLPPSDLGFIVDGVLQFGVQQVTCDKFGCRVVLRLLEHCPTEAMVGILDGLKAKFGGKSSLVSLRACLLIIFVPHCVTSCWLSCGP